MAVQTWAKIVWPVATFLASVEYGRQVLAGCYLVILARECATGEIDPWVAVFLSEAGIRIVLTGMALSREGTHNLGDHPYFKPVRE